MVYPLVFVALVLGGAIGWAWWGWRQEQPVIAWARANGGGAHLSRIGPTWLRERAGRYGYLLERVYHLRARPLRIRPVLASEVPLSRLRHLQWLTLYGADIGDDLMREVGRVEELKGLTLIDTYVTDDGLALLVRCHKLRSLGVMDSRLQDHCIGERGLAFLADHPELTDLHLSKCGAVDDRALPVLKRLTKLRNFYLPETSLTAPAILELKKALPNCYIHGLAESGSGEWSVQ